MSPVVLRTVLWGTGPILGLFALAAVADWDTERLGWPVLGIIAVVCSIQSVVTARAWKREAAQQGPPEPRRTRARSRS